MHHRIDKKLTTGEILTEIGSRLRGYRLQQNKTIAEVALAAGLGERTVRRLELGEGAGLDSIIKVLRALDRLDTLEAFLPPPLVSPLALAERGKVRYRAGSGTPPSEDTTIARQDKLNG